MKMPSGKPKQAPLNFLIDAVDSYLYSLANSGEFSLLDVQKLKGSIYYSELLHTVKLDLQHRTENALTKIKKA